MDYILQQLTFGGVLVWGVDPEALAVLCGALLLRCGACGCAFDALLHLRASYPALALHTKTADGSKFLAVDLLQRYACLCL